ncbi:hypothetical protein PFICI_00728 [Pestalotiopsis fici W106-1]|uniref:Heterokaryon incompatibility domain-containing protein n=1 Tax=Pestalotiopsis fici (strain W106-1 / CGMCC3.15140) TaxID=1229662 RepID=W3XLP7_PESFW|nr:uncharacterized protein PFICI_00728 [Pestalotiopsis fici W106-1]ETS86900.1 hypothetical protein PFICI_00728 [Pestalotiopsis fici W106-1]
MAMDIESLRQWYNEYLKSNVEFLSECSPLLQTVLADDLDTSSLERSIKEVMPSIQVKNGFCKQCWHIFDEWPLDYYSEAEVNASSVSDESLGEHDSRWKYVIARSCNTIKIEASTRMGCKFCAFLLQALKDDDLLTMFRKIESRLRRLGEPSTISLSIGTMWIRGAFSLWLDLPNKISMECNSESARSTFRSRSTPINDSENHADQPLELFDQANKWLLECCADHDCCNTLAETYLPTRLVSLVGGQPRLIITKDMGQPSSQLRYATLSYCWGERAFIQLRTDNIEAFKKGIPTADIPKTFQAAFEIASRLAIDFIWIDSLCIVQNDESDWEKEAEKMQQVYSSSYVTISASSATDVHQGCFLTPALFCDGFSNKVAINGRQERMQFDNYDFYKRSVLGAHLMTRAWAIQEKVLPPRTIHFGDRGVLWECRKGFAPLCLQENIRSDIASLVCDADMTKPFFWLKVVMAYSAANLTYRRDKLRALAGIARAVFNQTGDEYLSGIWRKDIELHLCWRVAGPRVTHHRANHQDRDWIAPSWSWASIDGGVEYNDADKHDEPNDDMSKPERYGHVCELGITHSENRDFGQSIRTMLHMRCSGLVLGRLCDQTTVASDIPEAIDSVVINYNDHDTEFPIRVDCINDSRSLHGKSVYLLPLAGGRTGISIRKHKGDWVDEKYISGLVLRKTAAGLGEFCRIGSFKFFENASFERARINEYLQPFLKIFNQVGAITAETVCAEMLHHPEHPEKRFLITIV